MSSRDSLAEQLGIAFEVLKMAVDPHHRRHAHRQVQVRRLRLDHLSKDLAYIHCLLSLVHLSAARITR